MSSEQPRVKQLGLMDYELCWRAMQTFTRTRSEHTQDELWLLQHPPVFTLGQAGDHTHVLEAGDIPLVQTDRGGQVTYHGPGQAVIYCLLDLRRLQMGVRDLVSVIERSVVAYLDGLGISATARREAPGVYVDGRKIASLGLRVSRGCSYHGLSFNVAMDLEPFQRINPCGMAGLEVAQLSEWQPGADVAQTATALVSLLLEEISQSSSKLRYVETG